MYNDGVTTRLNGNTGGFQDGALAVAKFATPSSYIFDDMGNMFVADSYNHRIRKIASSGMVSTVVGDGSPGYFDGQLNYPQAIALDPNGDLIILDRANQRVRKFIMDEEKLIDIAGTGSKGYQTGSGEEVSFRFTNESQGLLVDADGAIYLTDTGNHLVRKITME